MPKPKPRPRPAKKAAKPSAAILPAVAALQALVEDHAAWCTDDATLLRRLHASLADLVKLQAPSALAVIPARTERHFARFEAWLAAHGVDIAAAPFRIGFVESDSTNATLFATRDIPPDDVVITVPSAVMLTAETAASPLAPLLRAVPTLSTMPSIRLALHLLAEAANPASPFRPYIDTFPASFTIPFGTFSPDELLALHPSAAAPAAVKSLRAQVRNYTYIYHALHRLRLAALPPALVTYENFVWAVSVVMTRQNALPLREPPTLALVPLWDLCNHAPGRHSTSVVLADGEMVVECRAMARFAPGDPVTIFYGPRPNTQLLLFSGFVQERNEFDTVELRVPIAPTVELAAFKARVLAKMGVEVAPDGDGWTCAVDVGGRRGAATALGVARVVGMDKNGVAGVLKGGAGLPERSRLEEERRARDLVVEAVEEKLAEYEGGVDDGLRVSVRAARLIEELLEAERVLLRDIVAQLTSDVAEGDVGCAASAEDGTPVE